MLLRNCHKCHLTIIIFKGPKYFYQIVNHQFKNSLDSLEEELLLELKALLKTQPLRLMMRWRVS